MKLSAPYFHASYRFKMIALNDYFRACVDLLAAKAAHSKSIVFHFPLETLFKSQLNKKNGSTYINFVQKLSDTLGILVVWENIVWLKETDWTLKEKPIFDHIPTDISLCLDTGHLMIGSKNPRKEVELFLKRFGDQVKHLHLHENDLKHDLHLPPDKILTPAFVRKITRNRTWMYEPPD